MKESAYQDVLRLIERDPDPGNPNIATCGTCGRSWDDSIPTSLTPAPSARCPFEYEHPDAEDAGVTEAQLAAAFRAARGHGKILSDDVLRDIILAAGQAGGTS